MTVLHINNAAICGFTKGFIMKTKEKWYLGITVAVCILAVIGLTTWTFSTAYKKEEERKVEVCTTLTKAKECLHSAKGICTFSIVSESTFREIEKRVKAKAASEHDMDIYRAMQNPLLPDQAYVRHSDLTGWFLTTKFIETFRSTNEEYACSVPLDDSEIEEIKLAYARAATVKFLENLRQLADSDLLFPTNKAEVESSYSVKYLIERADTEAKKKFGHSITELFDTNEQVELVTLDQKIRHQIAVEAYKTLMEDCVFALCTRLQPDYLATLIMASDLGANPETLFEVVRYAYAFKAVALLEKLRLPDKEYASWYDSIIRNKSRMADEIRNFALLGHFELEEIGISEEELGTLVEQTDTEEILREKIPFPFPPI